MAHEHTTSTNTELDLLDELVFERLGAHARFTYFFLTGEGRNLPGTSVEESSGYVLDANGRAYFFWPGWDTVAGKPALIRWSEAAPSPRWEASGEYRRARARLGLA